MECPLKRPPGTEIYRDSKLGCAIYEVDGAQHKLYCQNLCLLARLFLESKVICFNVSEFLFYVLMEYDDVNHKERFMGYFSKVKSRTIGWMIGEVSLFRKKIQRLVITCPVYYVYHLFNEKDMENY